jgi:hypothetical protein
MLSKSLSRTKALSERKKSSSGYFQTISRQTENRHLAVHRQVSFGQGQDGRADLQGQGCAGHFVQLEPQRVRDQRREVGGEVRSGLQHD